MTPISWVAVTSTFAPGLPTMCDIHHSVAASVPADGALHQPRGAGRANQVLHALERQPPARNLIATRSKILSIDTRVDTPAQFPGQRALGADIQYRWTSSADAVSA